jgi:hypothetical protein
LLVVAAIVIGVVSCQVVSPEARARRRGNALYAPLVHYPGARDFDRQMKSTGADSCFLFWCDDHSLHFVYRLPDSVDVDAVKAHYRSHLPNGWKEADDSACISTNAPPGAEPPSGYVLQLPSHWLLLENARQQRVTVVIEPPSVTLMPATYSCFPGP